MDKIRLSLFFALATISYLMLLAWQNDYPPVVTSSTTETPSIDFGTTDIPASTEETIASSALDIPQQVPETLASTSSITAQNTLSAATSSQSSLIDINTDTFDVQIDLNGGDIVYLALPLYLKQLDDEQKDPFVLLEGTAGNNYIAQSGFIALDGGNRANYQSTSSSYTLAESEASLHVDLLTTDADGRSITKRYSFQRGSYLIGIEYIVNNSTSAAWQDNPFAQIKRDGFDDPSSGGSFSRTYLGFVSTSSDDPYIKIEFDDIDDGVQSFNHDGGWIGFSQHYFISALIPDKTSTSRFSTRKNTTGQYIAGFTGGGFEVGANQTSSYKFQFYAGPKDQYVLRDIAENLDLTIDYGLLWFLSSPIYWLLTIINSNISNFGLSIILLTLIVKGAFYKLSETQYKSMAGMRRVMPKMQQIKERHGDDKMKMQKATMELYKKEKINPFGGCLPMLVQMPVFIALYFVLLESVELRHAPFMLWVSDLSVRDPFFILPLLMGATMFLQTKLSPTPADPMQAKMMTFMPVMMTLFFLWFPAGLVLYWLTNSGLGILQQWYITRKIEAAYETDKTA